MKPIFKFAIMTLTMVTVSMASFATAPKNLTRGIVGPVSSNTGWSGYSVVMQIPGAGLIPPVSTTTAFYLGFTAGSEADISNMVLYTTPRGSATISAATPVTLGGLSNPSIDLASPSVCPVVEISSYNPCIVRLDPLTVTLSALSDYYLVVYFTASDSNNNSIGLTQPTFGQSSLRGSYASGDQTGIAVGGSIPSLSFSGQPYLLMYVMND